MATKAPPAYDMALVDHGFEARTLKGLTCPLGDHALEYGEIYQLAPDLDWTRMPVPGNFNHINLWLLDDDTEIANGYAIADTGLFLLGLESGNRGGDAFRMMKLSIEAFVRYYSAR